MRLILISGLSGAGKSVALHTLEDLGFYCVDNLPLSLLSALAVELSGSGHLELQNVAVVVDARNRHQAFTFLDDILDKIAALGIDTELLFFDADDETLLTRFSETRRKHPLTADNTSLIEAVRNERDLLFPVRSRATMRIDTSRTQYHQLRELVRAHVMESRGQGMSLQFESFGFKHGIPREADMVFDVRCLPNPHWHADLRPYTGRDQQVAEFLEKSELATQMYESLLGFTEKWLPSFEAENRSYLTIALGCTGGRHRSVFLAEKLAKHFRTNDKKVLLRHREL